MSDFRRPLHDEPLLMPARDASARVLRACFEDEIAIDFPSIDAVVDRMRAAFLAPDRESAPDTAAISLSAREARDGTCVRLELPVRRTCDRCGGHGGSWTEACAACAGTGIRAMPHRVMVSVPAGVADGARFRLVLSPPHALPTQIEVTVLVA